MGCSQDAMLQKFASAEDQATAKKYVDDLRAGHYEEIEAVMDPGNQGSDAARHARTDGGP